MRGTGQDIRSVGEAPEPSVGEPIPEPVEGIEPPGEPIPELVEGIEPSVGEAPEPLFSKNSTPKSL